MTIEELYKMRKIDLDRTDELYAKGVINTLEMATIKDEIDRDYRKKLSEIR